MIAEMIRQITPEMTLTMIVLVFVVWLFISEWVRVDVVGIIMMVTLPLLGLISAKEAFSGLSSTAVCSIIAVIIIGAGLDKTGVMNQVARVITRLAGRSEQRILILIGGTAGLISSMMQNIGAAALFLPAVLRISKRVAVPAPRLLMPMGFCAVIGGTITLVGSSPTILMNDLLVLEGERLEPFGLFTQAPIGICLLLSALVYLAVFGRYVLPRGEGEDDKGTTAAIMGTYRALEHVSEIRVPETFTQDRTLEEMSIQSHFMVTVIGIHHARQKGFDFVPRRTDIIRAGDTLAVVGRARNIRKLTEACGWELKDGLDVFAEELSRTNAGMVETIVSPRSAAIGKTIRDTNLKGRYQLNPIAVVRGRRAYLSGHTTMPLQVGDTILMQGRWDRFHRLKNLPQPRILTFASPLEGEILRQHKALWAVFWLVVALSQIILFDVSLSLALMSGALGMILTGVLSIDEAYRSVDWMTIFLLAGLIPLGIAFEKTGTARFIANAVLQLIGQPPPIVLLAVVGIMSSLFTLVLSNVGAAVLLIPLCMNMAMMVGVDPRMAALVVGISASNTFILPTHQVHALVMRPGGYRTADYAKAGAIMTVLFLVVELTVIYFLYGMT